MSARTMARILFVFCVTATGVAQSLPAAAQSFWYRHAVPGISAIPSVSAGPCGDAPTPGQVCADGSIYGGLTPDGNVPMYVAASSAPYTMPWASVNAIRGTTSETDGAGNTATLAAFGESVHPAAYYCATLSQHGHSDWYLPAVQELDVLWNDGNPVGVSVGNWYYWSSTEVDIDDTWRQKFDNRNQSWGLKTYSNSVRCVRK